MRVPRTVIVQKTAIFKLHNPSVSKRQVLDLAFARYGEAYNLALEKCRHLPDEWLVAARESKRLPGLFRAAMQIRPCLPVGSELKLPKSLRDGLLLDIAGNLLSYCQLRMRWESQGEHEGQAGEPKYPAPIYGYRPDAYYATLAEVVLWAGDSFDFIEFQAHLTREAKEVVRPLHFARAGDFALEQLDGDRWGTTLMLQPKGYIPTRLRFPLAFGEWHEQEYLGKGTPRCAHLCRREGEYFLHVSFEFEIKAMARGEEQAYLGIDRGVTKQAAFALVDLEGHVLHVGSLGRELRNLQITLGRYRQASQKAGRRVRSLDWQRRHQEEMLHQIANALVERARENRALVVVEDLDLQTGGRFVRSQYAKFEGILDYKLRLAGLLPPREVFGAYSSQICCQCGEDGQRGDPDREHFRCPACGAESDADENAAVNIARRALYRKSAWERRGGYRAFHRSFGSVG
jgi:IS605 OrfB family transposase